ncbi:MAG: LysM peptidoglycan-binding domain-containing protein [Lachnospiraceae bacterium]|nr:LysM peptidoglycan-binding domain-containing protein [Lachnospiraceae bacterium]
MNLTKRVVSCSVILILLTGISGYGLFLEWNGSRDGREVKKEEARREVFSIHSREDWNVFCGRVNQGEHGLDGKLEKDIDLEGEAEWILTYAGCFDGQGYTVSNTKRALFRCLEESGRVENLVIRNADIRPREDENSGAVVNTNDGLIRNCRVDGYVEGAYFVGGIVGFNKGRIEDCINHAQILSTATGKVADLWEEYTYKLYGAGGIAGFCGTGEEEGERGERNFVVGCVNYGSITGETLAGGICGFVAGGYGYLREQGDFDILNCRNYGTITVKNFHYETEEYETYCYVGGICGQDDSGGFFHCANLGKVQYDESISQMADYGYLYDYYPQGITNRMWVWDRESLLVDCVSLQGAVETKMRGEPIMEIISEELLSWEQGKLDYRINSWKFDIGEAVRYGELEPLEIEESTKSKDKKNYYLCEEFVLALPEGFRIEEVKWEGKTYALHIRYEPEEDGGLTRTEEIWKEYETWLIRKESDMETVLRNTLSSLPWDGKASKEVFMEEMMREMPGLFQLPLYNSVEHEEIHKPVQRCYSENRIVIENGVPEEEWSTQGKTIGRDVGTLPSMVLEGNPEDGIRGRWILLHTNRTSSLYPPRDYVDAVNESFYPLEKEDAWIRVKKGDTLWDLSFRYAGSGEKTELMGELNQLEDPAVIVEGESLLIPSFRKWSRRPASIEDGWFEREEGCVTADTGRKRQTVYLEPEEISWEELHDFGNFDGEETVRTLAAALENGTIQETLERLHQPLEEILSPTIKESMVEGDEVTWHLKQFWGEEEERNLDGESWFLSINAEQVIGQIVVQGQNLTTGEMNYYIIPFTFRMGGGFYIDEPLLVTTDSKEHYFLKSGGEYWQYDLWIVDRNEAGEIEGLAGYFYHVGDRQMIYLEKKEELRIIRRYFTWKYLPTAGR